MRGPDRSHIVHRSSVGNVYVDPPEPVQGSQAYFQRLAAQLRQIATWLAQPGSAEYIEAHPEVADLLERLDRDAKRIHQMIRFATSDRVAEKYDLTSDQFWGLVMDQDWHCPICQVMFEPGGARMNVDHNHETGEVRGILCNRCNTGLGMFKDSPENLHAALDYLDERGSYGPDEETA